MHSKTLLIAIGLVMAAALPAAAAGSSSGSMSSGDTMSSGSKTGGSMSSDKSMSSGGSMAGGNMQMMMAKPGQVYAMMPDGHVGTMTMTGDKMKSTIGMSSPLKNCIMTITDQNGQLHMVDTSSSQAQQECEKIAK